MKDLYSKILSRCLDSSKPLLDINKDHLPELHREIYSLIEKVYFRKQIIPSRALLLNKGIVGHKDESALKKLLVSLNDGSGEIPDSELIELLEDEYKVSGLYDTISEIDKAIEKRDMISVKQLLVKAEGYLLTGNLDLLDSDGDDFLSHSVVDTSLNGLMIADKYDVNELPLGSLLIISALTGVGKTTLAIRAFNNKIEEGVNAVFYSYEISATVLKARMLSNLTGVSFEEIKRGNFVGNNKEIIDKAKYFYVKDMKRSDIFSKSLEEIKALPNRKNKFKLRCTADIESYKAGKPVRDMPTIETLSSELDLFAKDGYNYFVIDLITSVKSSNPNIGDYQALNNTVMSLKSFALRTGSIIVCPAQADETNFTRVKYGSTIKEQADLHLALVTTPELKELNAIGMLVVKSRHGRGEYALIVGDKRNSVDIDTSEVIEEDYYTIFNQWRKSKKGIDK